MAEIILIRHGQASFGADDYDCLSELGLRQAAEAGKFLARCDPDITAIYSGELKRQQHTGELIASAHSGINNIFFDSGFDEIDMDMLIKLLIPLMIKKDENLKHMLLCDDGSKKSYQKILKRVFMFWVLQGPSIGGLPSWKEFSKRVGDSFREVISNQGAGSKTVVISSGGVIATLAQQAMGVPDTHVYSLFEAVLNASLTRFFYNNRGDIALQSFNDVSYLSAEDELLISYR